MERPHASIHYPKSLGEFRAWFPTDADCLDYLEWLRWPCGFVCPCCGHPGGWRLGDGRFMCTGCGSRTSVMAGTIFDRTRTPLTVWFSVCWHFATGKDGISALSLKRTLEIGSYQTVWAILHRLRSVLVRPDRERLCEGGGGRNLHWRPRIWTFGRPCQREEDPDVYCDRDPGAEGIRALSNGARGGCLLRIASLLRVE